MGQRQNKKRQQKKKNQQKLKNVSPGDCNGTRTRQSEEVRISQSAVAQSCTIWSALEGEAVNIAGKPGRYQVGKPGPLLPGLPYVDIITLLGRLLKRVGV